MKRRTKYAIVAIVLGVMLVLIPYIIVWSLEGDNMWRSIYIHNSGRIGYRFFDDFNSSMLNSNWTLVDVQGNSSIDLIAQTGWLKLTTSSPPLREWSNGPRLMLQSGLQGDLTLRTEVQSEVRESGESAGIIIWKDSRNWISLHRAGGIVNQSQIIFCGSDGQHIVCDLTTELDPTALLLRREGNNFMGYYYGATNNLRQIGEITLAFNDPLNVGLSITLTHEGEFSAFFNYFLAA